MRSFNSFGAFSLPIKPTVAELSDGLLSGCISLPCQIRVGAV